MSAYGSIMGTPLKASPRSPKKTHLKPQTFTLNPYSTLPFKGTLEGIPQTKTRDTTLPIKGTLQRAPIDP